MSPTPPIKTTHRWPCPEGSIGYDRWGRHGRPLLLLHAVLFDRAMWWPAAAALQPYATAIAVDLPGHGVSTARIRYDPNTIVDDLAGLLSGLRLNRAPVVVGHTTAGPLAERFAARYATHALVTVDELPRPRRSPLGVDAYLAEMGVSTLPEHYQDLIGPIHDAELFDAYAECMRPDQSPVDPPDASSRINLAVYSNDPPPAALRRHTGATWHREIYHVPGRFPHLADVTRFVANIWSVL